MASEANTVTLSTNLNVSPYYDDFDETKNYHRILFRPGLAVQARELTQMQSIQQNQIDRFAEHIFKEGSKVRGCEGEYDQKYLYVKLRNSTSTGGTVTVSSLVGKTLKGTTSGVRAIVLNATDGAEANTPNFKTIFVKYTAANTNGTRYFANNEILTAVDGSGLSANTIRANQGGAGGHGSAYTIASGIVYAKDHFIRVNEQTLILEKYNTTPSYRVGLNVVESIINSDSDDTLLDPAAGAYNYAAPGADRLVLTPTLAKYSFTDTSANNFIELLQIKNGIVQSIAETTEYSKIRDYMANRTADESGDYIVNGLQSILREHLDTGSNRGAFTTGNGGDSNKLYVEVSPGKAYIQGYDLKTIISKGVAIDKGIDYASVADVSAIADYGNYVLCDNVAGLWDLNGQDRVSLYSSQNNAVSGLNYSLTAAAGSAIGTAVVRAIVYYSGTVGLPNCIYKIYLADIQITTGGKSFANTQSIVFSSATANGKADIVGTSGDGSTASTFDTSYERGVFLTPASNVKRLRDTSGNVNTDWQFIKTFDLSLNNLGVGTVTSGEASETFSGSGVQSDTIATTDYIVVCKTSANTSALTGTIAIDVSHSNTIIGTGTAFTTQVSVGDVLDIYQGSNNRNFLVTQIDSATQLRVLNTPTFTKSGMPFAKRFNPGQLINMASVGRDGNRSINVTSATGITIDLNETFNSPATITGTVIAKMNKSNGQEAAKIIARDRLVQIRVGAGGGTSYIANTTGPWPLGLSDGFRLVSVRQKSGSNFASTGEGTDVTTHFTLSSGMHDPLYEHAQLLKKSSSSLAIASGDRFLVKFDHFTHSYSSGVGFFSVDSYPVNDATAGSDTSKIYTYQIPVYVSPETGTAIDLRNSIDVRPRMTDTANTVTTLTNISINPKLSTSTDEPSGGLRFPYPGENFSMDLDYYLARKDLITMDVNGRINSVRGTPNIKPAAPEVPKTTMDLATVLVSPYPSLPISVAIAAGRQSMACGVFPARHERYTMRDIGAIKDRVDHLEYYTSLNMLEKNANDLNIQDANGLDRFKNGMLVDAFTGHGIGNVHDLDYKISIDSKKGEMRPPFKLDFLTLEYDSSSSGVVRTNVTVAGISKDQTVAISNSQITFTAGETLTSGAFTATLRHQTDGRLYIENATGNFVASASVSGGTSGRTATISTVVTTTIGELITLPYSHEILVNQPYATTTRVVAGASWKFVGLLTLDPDNDFWVDTTQKPDVNINFDLNVDAWMHVASSWQTAWGNWQDVIGGRQETITGQRLVSQGQSILGNDIIQTDLVQDVIAVSNQQSRAGVQPTLVPYTQTQRIGNRITDINIQPYMRSRSVRFTARGMKPSSRLYTFFDGKNVGSYVTPTNSSFANTANESGRLTSDTSGNVYGIFRIPADDSLRFYTGAKIFRLTDNPTNVDGLGLTTSGAEAVYTASGLNTQQQDAVITTRGVQFTNADVHESQVVGSTEFASRGLQQTVVGQVPQATGGGQAEGDPIAQSFLVTPIQVSGVSGSGMFVTKIDLYFSRKDSTYPVTVELREIINGAMTGNLVPFSRVTISSADVNVSDDGSAATPFYFSAPVYLLADKEYGFIVIPGAASPEYAVYTARLGDIDITTGNRIVSQPATGVLYVSSNDTAFSTIQEEDIKYTLYYAKFTKTVGTAVLKNEARDYMTLSNVSSTFTKMGETIHGETLLFGTFANTKAVNAHVTYVQGMVSGATGRVREYTSGVSGNIKIYSVSATKFKGGERIRIRNTNATTGVIVGNSTGVIVSASYPIGTMEYYDAVNFANTRVHLTSVSYANSGSTTLNRTFIPNMYITGQTDGYYAKIMTMDKLQLDVANLRGDVLLPSNTSLAYAGKFATSDSTRDSSYIGLNLNDDMEFTAPRFVLSRSVESNTSASSATMAANKSAEVKITLTSNTIIGSPVVDTRRISLITVQNLINSNVAIASSEDGALSGGNALARYITRKVTLAEGQDAEDVVVYLDGYKPSGSDIVVYYKAIHADDSDGFDNARWIPMSLETATTQVSSSVNTNDFREYKYIVSTYDNVYRSGANTVNSGILEYRNTTNKARFVGYKHLAIKIVLQKDTSTQPPRVRNLRIIALQR